MTIPPPVSGSTVAAREDAGMDSKPRIYLHPDQDFVSIGFDGTPDTLLRMPERPAGHRDHARAVAWVEAVSKLLEEIPDDTR